MPSRVIKESIKRSPQIDSLTWFEEVLFYRLIVTADDFGCLDGRSIVLKNELFPTKDNIPKKAIEDSIEKLVKVGLLVRYEADGSPYLFLKSWEKHQRVRNRIRKLPAPPNISFAADCGELPRVAADCGELPPKSNPIQSESNPIYGAEECDSSAPAAPVIELPLNDGSFFPISEELAAAFAGLYPNVNVPQELREMKGWLIANPKKRKTRSGVMRFVNAWLSKEQDKGGRKGRGANPSFDLQEFEESAMETPVFRARKKG